MRDCQQPGLISNNLVDIGEVEVAVGCQRNSLEDGVLPAGQHHPRDQVSVMLHFGDHYLITLTDIRLAPAVSDKVNSFGGAAGKNDLLSIHSTDKTGRVGSGTCPRASCPRTPRDA